MSAGLRLFVNTFRISTVKETLEISFSRSSGAGGQNVNKVNTKAELRFKPANSSWLPDELKDLLVKDSAVNKKGEFIVQSDRYRTQLQNVDDCLHKLESTILEKAKTLIPKEASVEALQRIEKFKEISRARVMIEKQHRSRIKASRRGDDD